jgi:RecJ-like exonuclease
MNQALKISLVLSLLGILLLLYISIKIQPLFLEIALIDSNQLGKNIQLNAKIIQIRDFPQKSFQILTLEDKTGKITATTNSRTSLKINQTEEYSIYGKIQEYNKTLQVNIDKIVKRS